MKKILVAMIAVILALPVYAAAEEAVLVGYLRLVC